MNLQELLLCDACGEGKLHPSEMEEEISYKGQAAMIVMKSSICDVCHSELTNAVEALFNKRQVNRFKKTVDGIPLGTEITAMRKVHGITQVCASHLFGGGVTTFSKYENDDVFPDEAMVTLLKLAIEYPDIIARIAGQKGIPLTQSANKKSPLSITRSIQKIWEKDGSVLRDIESNLVTVERSTWTILPDAITVRSEPRSDAIEYSKDLKYNSEPERLWVQH